MAEALTIRERIEREAKRRLEAIDPAPASVERWDSRGNDVGHESLVIYPAFEAVQPDAIAEDPSIVRTLELIVAVVLAQPNTDSESTSEQMNKWIGRLERALTDQDDFGWVEPSTGEQLLIDAIYDGADEPAIIDNQPEMELRVRFQLTYETSRGNPETGGAATAQTE